MPVFAEKPTLITFKASIKPDKIAEFAQLQAHLNATIMQITGFVSIEFLAEGIIVLRFSDGASAADWKASSSYASLLADLKACAVNREVQEEWSIESSISSGVTEVIITEVNPSQEVEYRKWSAKIHQVEATFPGFKGVYLQAPAKGKGRFWITLLQFHTIEDLDRWLNSNERQALLQESVPLISSIETHRMISPFSGWFASIAKRGEVPPVWKQTMLVLLVLFPIVMLELKFLYPWLTRLDVSLKTFIGNAISVSLVAFPMMPIAIWFLNWWLSPSPQYNVKRITCLGTLLVLFLYAILVFLFWNSL